MLTQREQQVLEQMVRGRSSKEIAHELGVSRKTIDGHRSHILHKMVARNTADLVRKAINHEEAPVPE